jgi:uncharacterized protein YjbI with pentapeptide repeats
MPTTPEGRSVTDASERASGEFRLSKFLDDWPTPAGPAPDLPAFADKADDLEAIKSAVDNAASVGGGLWLSYVFVLFYLAVAAGAVTHVDLFLEKPVKLPFLNVELPLTAFFLVAPILFLIIHAYTLVHLAMLGDKAKWFHRELYRQIKLADELPKAERARRQKIRTDLRRQLPSNIFVQLLAGPSNLREKGFGLLLRAIASVTMVVAPVLLLLLMQIQFLPYHDRFITWIHRVVLLVDIGLLWWLWGKILSGHAVGDRRRPSSVSRAIGAVLSFLVVAFSVMVVTFPGEGQEDLLATWPEWMVASHEWLFSGPVDDTTRRRTSLFSNTLVLPGFNIYEGLGIDDPEKAKWHDFVFRARGRDLRGAIFDLASLPKVDFEGAQLQGASLFRAVLQRASLYNAQLQGAALTNVQLQGASLDQAQFQGAWLFDARLQDVSLAGAQLQGASLELAQLQGASLAGAQLQGASLELAQLQGASLQMAVLDATNLSGAFLWRTNVSAPNLSQPKALRFSEPPHWRPLWRKNPLQLEDQPWDDKAYQDLRKTIEALPPGDPREQALTHIWRLDCASDDKTLALCNSDPSLSPPHEAVDWRNDVERASVDETAYAAALAAQLKALVCSGGKSAIYVVRGLSREIIGPSRLQAAGSAAIDLVDDLTNKDSNDCPVSAALTDADRGNLLQIKQKIEVAR